MPENSIIAEILTCGLSNKVKSREDAAHEFCNQRTDKQRLVR